MTPELLLLLCLAADLFVVGAAGAIILINWFWRRFHPQTRVSLELEGFRSRRTRGIYSDPY